ncbi:MAG: DUF4956 domain-containing protein [Bacillota bacterium]|nr:DUF4956 domain-containing protein [Bacillota bacterium]
MTLFDVFKVNTLDNRGQVSLVTATFSLLCAFGLGLVIHSVYRKVFSGVMYSRPYNTSLIMLTMLTAFVILPVTSDIRLSLGMVGALSIVRFRTAIKGPLDLVFLFWAIGTGIIAGAGLFPLAFLGTAIIAAVMLLVVKKSHGEYPYILVVQMDEDAHADEIPRIIGHRVNRVMLKSKTVSKGQTELIYEVRLRGLDAAFMHELDSLPGVKSVSLVSYDGQYAG